jgi:hypothetical protein
MASIATVVTMGYGSFGSVNELPTLGYGIGEEEESFPSDGWKAEKRSVLWQAEKRSVIWKASNES